MCVYLLVFSHVLEGPRTLLSNEIIVTEDMGVFPCCSSPSGVVLSILESRQENNMPPSNVSNGWWCRLHIRHVFAVPFSCYSQGFDHDYDLLFVWYVDPFSQGGWARLHTLLLFGSKLWVLGFWPMRYQQYLLFILVSFREQYLLFIHDVNRHLLVFNASAHQCTRRHSPKARSVMPRYVHFIITRLV